MANELLILAFWSVGCLLLEAFFSGSEIALVSCDKLKLTHHSSRGDWGARIALSLAHRPEWFFSTTLFGQNLFIVANSVLVTFFIFRNFGVEYEFLGLLLAPVVLIFGEAVPKSVFQEWSNRLASRTAPVVLIFSYLFYPIVWLLSKLTLLLFGGVRGTLMAGHTVTTETLEFFLQELEPSQEISPDFKTTLLKSLSFARQRAGDMMTPLSEVFSLPEETQAEAALEKTDEEGYSYIPIYQRRSTHIIGVVGVFDLLMVRDLKTPLSRLASLPLYVPEAMTAKELHIALKSSGKNFAVVVNERGGAVGVITMEDLWEEVVGEIRDEFDTEGSHWNRISETRVLVKGNALISELNEVLRWGLPQGPYETIAGFLLDRLGHIPARGEIHRHGELTFLVKTVTSRSIEEVLVEVEERT